METVITREELLNMLYNPDYTVYNSYCVLVGPAQEDDYNHPYYVITKYDDPKYPEIHIDYPLESNEELDEYLEKGE